MPGEYMHIVTLYLLLANELISPLPAGYSLIHRKLSPISPPTSWRYFIKGHIVDIVIW